MKRNYNDGSPCQICASHVDPPRKLYCSAKCSDLACSIVNRELEAVKKQEEVMDRMYAVMAKHQDLIAYQETVGRITPETINRITSWFTTDATKNTRATTQ